MYKNKNDRQLDNSGKGQMEEDSPKNNDLSSMNAEGARDLEKDLDKDEKDLDEEEIYGDAFGIWRFSRSMQGR